MGKKTNKRKKKLERALEAVKKHKKKKTSVEAFNFSALHLIYDPQEFCEKLFRQMEKTTERFEVRLMMIDLISRLIGIHRLIVLNFYPFMKRFLQPHQREVVILVQMHYLLPFIFIVSIYLSIYRLKSVFHVAWVRLLP